MNNLKRTRLDDVVAHTGLSRSTVDRVLNNRAGVREATRQKVEAALNAMGYAPDALSSRLASNPTKIEVFLSEGTNPFFQHIRDGFERALDNDARKNLDVNVSGFDPYAPLTLQDLLCDVGRDTSAVIIVGTETPEVTTAINILEARDIRVVTIISDVPGSCRTTFIGQDNFLAGRTAGRLMLESVSEGAGRIALLIGHLQFRHLLDRRSGFEQIVGLARPELKIETLQAYGNDPSKVPEIMAAIHENYDDLKGIYLCGSGQPKLVSGLGMLAHPKPVIIAHEVNQISHAALKNRTFRFVVAHDIYEVGRRALDAALSVEPVDDHVCGISIYVAENVPNL